MNISRLFKRCITIGIRREDPSRIWERRSPLTPTAVQRLVDEQGVEVHVEHCDRRVFTDDEFLKAGASIRSNLSMAQIILGIKEPPLSSLLLDPVPGTHNRAQRTYMIFSHTAKGQVYNLPLLSSFLDSKSGPTTPLPTNAIEEQLPRLIDFELLTSETDGKRTVGFGWFAGVAGVLESLSAMAHSHLEIGVASPFLYTPRPHTLPSLHQLRAVLHGIGQRIINDGTPPKLGPFVIGLTGTGNVAEGCLSMLSELPIVKVNVKDLPALVSDPNTDRHKVYLVHALPSDYFVRNDGSSAPFSREHYYANPHLYDSKFCYNVAPYLTLFLNGAGWAPGYPRIMTNEQLTIALRLAQSLGGARFTNIGDISCDPHGGLEFLTHSTTLSTPFDKYRPATLPSDLPSVQIMSVDILPTSIPLDASEHFSEKLYPYLESLISTYKAKDTDTNDNDTTAAAYGRALERATIANGGELVGKHQWLGELVQQWRVSQFEKTDSLPFGVLGGNGASPKKQSSPVGHGGVLRKKKVLMLGSGMVAGPAVDRIASRKDVELIIASNSSTELAALARNHDNVRTRQIDMSDAGLVSDLIEECDVAISLLPVALHAKAAELCIQFHKHLVTASYISPTMKQLHHRAVASDVLLLNEIGLDPGIDHCSAISLVTSLQAQDKSIVSFVSFCGGLPAPELGDKMGPLGYKFSWSPRGVLTAALNPAVYRLQDKVISVLGEDLLKNSFEPITFGRRNLTLEGIPNRDSISYGDVYGLGKDVRTLLRGTLRYPGFSELMQFFKELGLLETDGAMNNLQDWKNLVSQATSIRTRRYPTSKHPVPPFSNPRFQEALDWLLSPPGLPQIPTSNLAPLDIFAKLLASKLRYEPEERDMVVLVHEVIARSNSNPNASEEVHTSSLIAYGDENHSAMARTVGLPVAIAALRVLDGKVDLRGVHGPGDESVREPVLEGLQEVGLGMDESMFVAGSREKQSIEERVRIRRAV